MKTIQDDLHGGFSKTFYAKVLISDFIKWCNANGSKHQAAALSDLEAFAGSKKGDKFVRFAFNLMQKGF